MNFEIWIRNSVTDSEMLISDNSISDNLRIRYNKEVKNITDNEYKTMINSFKKEVNEKFNLILSNNDKIHTSNKELLIDSLSKNKPYTFEAYSGKYGYTVAPIGYHRKLWSNNLLGVYEI